MEVRNASVASMEEGNSAADLRVLLHKDLSNLKSTEHAVPVKANPLRKAPRSRGG